ncbi:transcription factor MYB92-like [Salvia miltiorrhiza]|uniref:transcription factor MYB92-like n=1 Tax=Salvia miltiorrhiza TaxID=226208 RepID=UPI0025AD6E0A|nr:transcription factor MYB92-like [Salvia miltiorrhiza]
MSEAETRHRKGAWSKDEDEKLKTAVDQLGDKNWVRIEKFSGLARPAKNCRLRWINYLRPNLKKYPFTKQEQDLIFQLHATYGNAWSRIASHLPGRSDNEIKNFWHKSAKKRQREGLRISPINIDSSQTMISTSQSHFQLKLPPFSSMPAPSQTCLPIQDSYSTVESDFFPTQPITQLPSIQFNPVETLGENSYMHQVKSDSNLEIINELRKARARVRFLEKKLRQRGISNKRNNFKQSSRNDHLFIKSPQGAHLLTTHVPLDENSSRMEEITEDISRRKDDIQDSTVISATNLQETERSVSEESRHSEMSTHGENSDSKASLHKGFEREEDLFDEICNVKNSETFPEQRHHNYHVNSQYNVIAPNWNLWNECSSSLLQELEEDLFGERSQIDQPSSPKRHMDALGAVYSQSSATTLEGDESGQHFKCSMGQEFSDGLDIRFPDSNLGPESLPVNQNTAVGLVECSYLVSQPVAVHESMGRQDFSLQTSGENISPTQPCQSSFIEHQYHEAQQCSLDEFYGGMTESTSGEETWKQELMEDLVRL